jgi:hypothetical protein
MNLNESTTHHDNAFRDIQALVWLPWVGHHFLGRPLQKRLLVVGESNYVRPQTPEQLEILRKQRLEDLHYTRDVVSECLINEEWRNKTLDTLPQLLFKTTKIDRCRLWGDSAFYNLIQRPVNYNQEGQRERPTEDDFVAGWRVFLAVVRIIQPSHCLFIGVSAANTFDHSMANQNISFNEVSYAPSVDGIKPRVAKIEIAGMTTKLIFVHHLCRCKALDQWHDYLQNQHADFMNWIRAESYDEPGI